MDQETNNTVFIYMTSSNALGQVRSKCEKVIQWFDTLKIKYTRVDLFAIPEKRAEMEQLSGKKELPQVFIGKKLFGGFDVIESMIEDECLAQQIKEFK